MILPSLDLTAMNARSAHAITTSLTRAQGLTAEGYTYKRISQLGRTTIEVTGKPTQHTKRGTKEVYWKAHGPYLVDPRGTGTCTCEAFSHNGICPHLPAAREWHDAWEAGESVPVAAVPIEAMSALREIGGTRYNASERRVVVFRSWERAGTYWQEQGLVSVCEIVPIGRDDLAAMMASGKYAGLRLATVHGHEDIDFGGQQR